MPVLTLKEKLYKISFSFIQSLPSGSEVDGGGEKPIMAMNRRKRPHEDDESVVSYTCFAGWVAFACFLMVMAL